MEPALLSRTGQRNSCGNCWENGEASQVPRPSRALAGWSCGVTEASDPRWAASRVFERHRQFDHDPRRGARPPRASVPHGRTCGGGWGFEKRRSNAIRRRGSRGRGMHGRGMCEHPRENQSSVESRGSARPSRPSPGWSWHLAVPARGRRRKTSMVGAPGAVLEGASPDGIGSAVLAGWASPILSGEVRSSG